MTAPTFRDPLSEYTPDWRRKRRDPLADYTPEWRTTDAQKAAAKELFSGASEFGEKGEELKPPTAADVIGLNDPIGKAKQLAASLPEYAVMAARDVAGSLAGLARQPHEGVGGEIPEKPADPMAGLRKGQEVREQFNPALEKIDQLAGGQPTDMLGMAARMAGPLPIVGGIRGALGKRVATKATPEAVVDGMASYERQQARMGGYAKVADELEAKPPEPVADPLADYREDWRAPVEAPVAEPPKSKHQPKLLVAKVDESAPIQEIEAPQPRLKADKVARAEKIAANRVAKYEKMDNEKLLSLHHSTLDRQSRGKGGGSGWTRYDDDVGEQRSGGNNRDVRAEDDERILVASRGELLKRGLTEDDLATSYDDWVTTKGERAGVELEDVGAGLSASDFDTSRLGGAGTKTVSAIALGGTGAALSQSDNPELQKTGHGILALTTLHAVGRKRLGAARDKVGGSLVDRLKQSPAGKAAVEAINPDALLTPEVRTAIKQYELDVSTASARAKELGGKARALGPAADRKVSDVMERENFEPTRLSGPETEQVLAVAAEIGEEFTKQGRAKVSAGLLSEQAVNKREGAYLPRKYAYHEAEDARGGLASGTSVKKVRVGPEYMRQEIAPDIRTMLGEIREASYRTEQGLTKGGKDLAAQRLFETLKQSPDAMHPGYSQASDALRVARQAGDHKAIVEAQATLKSLTRGAGDEWVTLPDTRGLGPLRGAVVRREVASSINGLPEVKGAGGKLLTYWKKSHTVYNPGTHIGNFASNVSLAHLAGLNIWEMPTALRAAQIELRRYGPAAKALTEAGVLDVNVATATAEGAAMVGKTGKVQLRELAGTTRPETAKVLKGQGVRPLGPIETAMRKTDKKVSKLYNNEDNVFRVALYMKATKPTKKGGMGLAPKEAAEYARENLINFRTRSPLLNWVRNTGLSPFVLFPAKALPLVAGQIVEHPWRWITLAATWGAVDQYAQRKVGRIPDEDLSDRDQRNPAGYLMPGTTQLPVKGRDGQKYGFDVSRFTPLSAVTSGGVPGSTGSAISGNIPQALQPSGPLVDILARTALNTDPFTGEKFIRPSDNATDIAKKATLGKVGAGTFTPGALAGLALPSALSYQVPRVASDLANDDPEAAKVDAFGVAGLRPRVIRPGQESSMRQYREQREMQDIQAEMRRDLRKAKSTEARVSVFERARKKRKALQERTRHHPELADQP